MPKKSTWENVNEALAEAIALELQFANDFDRIHSIAETTCKDVHVRLFALKLSWDLFHSFFFSWLTFWRTSSLTNKSIPLTNCSNFEPSWSVLARDWVNTWWTENWPMVNCHSKLFNFFRTRKLFCSEFTFRINYRWYFQQNDIALLFKLCLVIVSNAENVIVPLNANAGLVSWVVESAWLHHQTVDGPRFAVRVVIESVGIVVPCQRVHIGHSVSWLLFLACVGHPILVQLARFDFVINSVQPQPFTVPIRMFAISQMLRFTSNRCFEIFSLFNNFYDQWNDARDQSQAENEEASDHMGKTNFLDVSST